MVQADLLGKEGPIIQIGSTVGSTIAQKLGLTTDENQMKTIKVKNIMNTNVETVSEDLSLVKLSEKIIKTGHMAFPVVREKCRLIGIVTHSDFDKISEEDHENLNVKDVMTEELITVKPDDTLEDVLVKTEDEELSHFPVVNPNNPKEIVGFFTKGDIIRAYTKKRAG